MTNVTPANQASSGREPITWVDVARKLSTLEPVSREWSSRPKGVVRAQVDWTGITIEVREKIEAPSILNWLADVFPSRIEREADVSPPYLQLDGPSYADKLPIEIELRSEFEAVALPFLGSIDSRIELHDGRYHPHALAVPIVACHSVKGGTGRTTIAVATAKLWRTKAAKPILLVDGDLEAPGISYLFRQVRSETRIALEDVIALAHSDDSKGYSSTIEFAAARLADHQLDDGIIVLPLRRDLDELASSSIRAEHLSTTDHPFALSELLSNLAKACGCGGVVVDLRAGLVPLAAQFILDPAVARIFTTSLSGQSLEATAALVRLVARELRRCNAAFPKPLLVVNRVPSVLRETGADDTLLQPTLDRMTSDVLQGYGEEVGTDETILDNDVELAPWSLLKIPEISDLQVMSGGWSGFSDQLSASGFTRRLDAEFSSWLEQDVGYQSAVIATAPTPEIKVDDQGTRRKKLSDFASRFVAAETADQAVDAPLVTGPLWAMSRQFNSQLPIIVSEGAKGTGKTLTARFLIKKATWGEVVASLSQQLPAIDGPILPVLGSIQTSGQFQAEIDRQRTFASDRLKLKNPQLVHETKSLLLKRLADKKNQDRAGIWLDAIAWSAGFEVGKANVGDRFLERLRKRKEHVLAIIEGIEELYDDPFAGHMPQNLRGLLVDLPQRLKGEPGRPIGLIVFARRDSVDAAVPQNRSQFRITYKDFELSWSDNDVLELAAWIATRAGSLDVWDENFRQLTQADRESKLERLWGRKLGPDDRPGKRTAEAYTAPWVLAALSDLQGRLVARDLVRFLAEAASYKPTEAEDVQYANRLLVPRALKSAIKPTSIAKVKETVEEIRDLKAVFQKFGKREVRAPIDEAAIKSLSLSSPDINLLRRHGILFGVSPPYEVPELFRMGLNLKHTGARHSVINLRRKSRQSLGLRDAS